jgi:hypothetical protein
VEIPLLFTTTCPNVTIIKVETNCLKPEGVLHKVKLSETHPDAGQEVTPKEILDDVEYNAKLAPLNDMTADPVVGTLFAAHNEMFGVRCCGIPTIESEITRVETETITPGIPCIECHSLIEMCVSDSHTVAAADDMLRRARVVASHGPSPPPTKKIVEATVVAASDVGEPILK